MTKPATKTEKPKRKRHKAPPVPISAFEIETAIKADIDLVNESPEADPDLTAFLKGLVEMAADYRADLDRGFVEWKHDRALATYVAVRPNYDGSQKKRHDIVFEFNERLKTYAGQDLRRFRRCEWENCNDKSRKIFWADRLNKRFCSQRCQNAFNQNEHRIRAAK